MNTVQQVFETAFYVQVYSGGHDYMKHINSLDRSQNPSHLSPVASLQNLTSNITRVEYV